MLSHQTDGLLVSACIYLFAACRTRHALDKKYRNLVNSALVHYQQESRSAARVEGAELEAVKSKGKHLMSTHKVAPHTATRRALHQAHMLVYKLKHMQCRCILAGKPERHGVRVRTGVLSLPVNCSCAPWLH